MTAERNAECLSPLPWETLVAYWAGDLPAEEEETAELHLMSCAACTAQAEVVAAMTDAIRTEPVAAPGPALRVVQGERRDAPAPPPAQRTARPAAPRRRWFLASGGAAMLAAAVALFVLIPRGGLDISVRLPAPVRDAVVVEISPASSVRDVRLEPELPEGTQVNAARIRNLDGDWLNGKVEAGPPFAVKVSRSDLPPGRYELQLVFVTPEGKEQPRGFYRFRVNTAP